MITFKNLLFLLFAGILLSSSCIKEDTIEGITREDFYGNYIGEDTNSMGGWSKTSFRITEAPIGETYITIIGLARYPSHHLIANTDQENISIKEQSFHVDEISPGGFHTVYDAKYFGSGLLDTTKHEIIFHFTEKQVLKDTTFVIQWIATGIRQ
jgi:hypothetical protein